MDKHLTFTGTAAVPSDLPEHVGVWTDGVSLLSDIGPACDFPMEPGKQYRVTVQELPPQPATAAPRQEELERLAEDLREALLKVERAAAMNHCMERKSLIESATYKAESAHEGLRRFQGLSTVRYGEPI